MLVTRKKDVGFIINGYEIRTPEEMLLSEKDCFKG